MCVQWLRCQEWFGGWHTRLTLSMSVGRHGYEKCLTLAFHMCKFRILHTLLSLQYLVLLCVSTDLFICHRLALLPKISLNECDVNSTQCVHLNRAFRNSVSLIHISVISPTSRVWRGWMQVSDRPRPWRKQHVFCLSQFFCWRNDITCRTHTNVNGGRHVMVLGSRFDTSPSNLLSCSLRIQQRRPEGQRNSSKKGRRGQRERWGEVWARRHTVDHNTERNWVS